MSYLNTPLTEIEPSRLTAARSQLHQAIQLVAMAGRTFSPESEEDLHANTGFAPLTSLVGKRIKAVDTYIQVYLDIAKLELGLWFEKTMLIFPLDGKTWADALDWLKIELAAKGLDSTLLSEKFPYEIPSYPTASGAPFSFDDPEAFQQLAGYFSITDTILKEVLESDPKASDIRCWPHHFDIASLILLLEDGSKSIGAGMSPGDGTSEIPYFYLTPWPYPDRTKVELPALPFGGYWHTEGWVGILMPVDQIWGLELEGQTEKIKGFFSEGIQLVKKMIR